MILINNISETWKIMKVSLKISSILLGICAVPNVWSSERPNILIIVADDLGWGDVGYHNPEILTPNIDQLSREGIVLNRFYSAPMSSPTRAGLMTGRYQDRYGLRHVVIRPWFDYGLDPQEKILPQVLADAGYKHRGIIGKWHLGHSRPEYHPLRRGFTCFYGHMNGAIDYFDHTRTGELDWHKGFKTSYDKGYSTDLITGKAVHFIHRYYKQSPFFLYVAYNAPHSPLQAQEKYLVQNGYDKNMPAFQNGPGKGNTMRQTFAAMVTNLDAGIGDILHTLEQLSIANKTIVLFLSDNGADLSLGGSNGELRGGKLTEWEGGMRVPAIIRWPEQLTGGWESSQVTGCVDVLPTLCDLIGYQPGSDMQLDGISISPVLKKESGRIDRNLYLGCGTVVNSEWKLIKQHTKRGLSRMVIHEDLLFSMSLDPCEAVNVRDEQGKIYQELLDVLSVYESIEPTMTPPPDQRPADFVPPKEWDIRHHRKR